MGRGDRKSRKGKIWRGSYGNTRPKKTSTLKNKKFVKVSVPKEDVVTVIADTVKPVKVKTEKVKAEKKKTPAKKTKK